MRAMNLLYANDTPGAHAPSYYAATSNGDLATSPLAGDARADVCVVGGGYSGLSAALHLAERGYAVTLLEAHKVGWGASGRNGGQLGSGQRRGQDELEALLGPEDARRLWGVAEEAKATAKGLIAAHDIACDLKPGVFYAAHKRRYARHYREAAAFMNERYGHPLRYLDREETRALVASDRYHAGYLDPTTAHLHPLNYALGLARAAQAAGVRIHEGTEVLSIDPDAPSATTAAGRVKADHLILACNGYLGGLAPAVAARVMPINNFIIATEPLADPRAVIAEDVAVSDSKFVINYFRFSADDRMLFGGRESYGYRFPADIGGFVRKAMVKILPQLSEARIDHAWGGTLAITMKRLPCFARLGPAALSISGYSGHGVAMATMAGKIAAEAVGGQAERFDLFARLPIAPFPGGSALRSPLLALAMIWYTLRDRL